MTKKKKMAGSKVKPADSRPAASDEQANTAVKNKVPIFLYIQLLFGLATIIIAIIGLFFKDSVLLYVPLVLGGLLIFQALNIFTTGMGKKGAGYAALTVGIIAVIIFVVFIIINLTGGDTPPQEIK